MTPYFGPRTEDLAQGDILDGVSLTKPKTDRPVEVVRRGIVVSHSCDFTKFKDAEAKGDEDLDRFPLLVAPVFPLTTLRDPSAIPLVRDGRILRYFYLPTGGPFSEEYAADFWRMQPCPVQELLAHERLTSLVDQWQARMGVALVRLFTRRNISTPPAEVDQ